MRIDRSIRQYRYIDSIAFVVVVLVVILVGVAVASHQPHHNNGQYQNACQYFENFALHFGSPFICIIQVGFADLILYYNTRYLKKIVV